MAPDRSLVYTGVKRMDANADLFMLSIVDQPVDDDVDDGQVYILTGFDLGRLVAQLQMALNGEKPNA